MAIEVLLIETNKLTGVELELANKEHPPFVSTHEGYGVMLEEYDELKEQTKLLKKAMDMLWNYIKLDAEPDAMKMATIIESEAQKAAAEAIQTAAMARKFRKSLDRREVITNDSINTDSDGDDNTVCDSDND